jgi:hypothetical protein
MALQAEDAGYTDDDPRVRFAVLEELAILQRAAELERRVPHAEIASDIEALRAYYDQHLEEFMAPERRSIEGVAFDSFAAADEALRRLKSADVELADVGDVVSTALQVRNDAEHPAFHAVLFEASLREGDILPMPVFVGEALLVGRIKAIEPPTPRAFDAPETREHIVEALRNPRLSAAQEVLLAELRARWNTGP